MDKNTVIYIKYFFFTVICILTLILSLNIISDPYNQLGTPRVTGLNHDFYHQIDILPNVGLSFTLNLLDQTSPSTVLIGTSKTRFGFNTTITPDIFNAGISAAGLDLTQNLFHSILNSETPPSHIFIETTLSTRTPRFNLSNKSISFYDLFFSKETTRLSFKILKQSVLGGDRNPKFKKDKFYSFPYTYLIRVTKPLLDAVGEFDYPKGTDVLTWQEVFKEEFSNCPQNNYILFYEPPHHPDALKYKQVREAISKRADLMRSIIYNNKKTYNCVIQFVNLGSPEGDWGNTIPDEIRRPENWYDITHFNDHVGQVVLKRLLEISKNLHSN